MGDERLPASSGGITAQERINLASQALEDSCGEHALADVAAILAFCAAMTIVTQATGHTSGELDRLAPFVRVVAWLKQKMQGLVSVVILVLLGVSAAAVAIHVA